MIDVTTDPAYRMAHISPDGQPAYHRTTNTIFYVPVTDTNYHMSRYVAAGAHNYFCQAGITKDTLVEILNQMEVAVNANKTADVAVLINNLRYRTRYPVDEDAALRLAMIFHFLPGEDPNKVEPHWTEKKLELVKEDPAAYSFFMELGIRSSPTYSGLPAASSPTYLQERRNDLEGLTPLR